MQKLVQYRTNQGFRFTWVDDVEKNPKKEKKLSMSPKEELAEAQRRLLVSKLKVELAEKYGIYL